MRKAEAQDKPLEVAIAIGCAPAVIFASQWKGPCALCGQPIEVVA